ncbi:MAG: protein kinase, partial [Cellvibrionales bacterium]
MVWRIDQCVDDLPAPYQAEKLLGEGGEGLAWLAWDPLLQRRVVCKRLKHADRFLSTRTPQAVGAVSKLQRLSALGLSPHIYGLHRQAATAWLVTEYFAGEELAAFSVEQRQQWGVARVAGWAVDLLKFLLELRSVSVVHGDLSPKNVLLGETGRLCVIDCLQAMPPGSIKRQRGTPGFMRHDVGADISRYRDDQYAVGCLLYWLLGSSGPRCITDDGGRTQILSPPRPTTVAEEAKTLWSLAAALTTEDEWSTHALKDGLRMLQQVWRSTPVVEDTFILSAPVEDASTLPSRKAPPEPRCRDRWLPNAKQLRLPSRASTALTTGVMAALLGLSGWYLQAGQEPGIRLGRVDIVANTALPSEFSREWLIEIVNDEFEAAQTLPQLSGKPWVMAVTCDYRQCALSVNRGGLAAPDALMESFPVTNDT